MTGKPLVVVGCAALGLEILEAAESSGTYHVIGFLDDATDKPGLADRPVLGALDHATKLPAETQFVHAISTVTCFHKRKAIGERLGIAADRWATVVHPSAVISPCATLKPGSVVLAQAYVGPNVRFGAHAMLLPGGIVQHDCSIGAFATLCGNVTLAGRVRVGVHAFVGSAAVINTGVSVGEQALVGQGANVLHDVPDGRTSFGNPARIQ